MKNNPTWNQKKTRELFRAILELKTQEDCRKFFRDLCTLEEIAALSDRWQMALLLSQGLSQRDVAKKLKVSIATVTRVSTWLHHGMGGYALMLARMK